MYLDVLKQRVLIYDGAMGTSIQTLELSASDFGGAALEGCNDYLVITRPDAIETIHASFLDVGCDVLETDTFRSNRLTLREYDLHERVVEINRAAARLARGVADKFATSERPRFVAGSIGPSGLLPSTSDPVLGNITYDELAVVFEEQAHGLIEGGVDVLLIETSQDILEVKAQVTGIRRALVKLGVERPIQAQVTLDTSARMLLGTDITAAMTILESLRVDVIGLNCSTGPEHMRQPVRYLSENSRLPLSVIPNAGIPLNEGGRAIYPLTPAALADAHEEFVTKLGVSVVGGCCGTTPEHLRAVVERVWGRKPAQRNVSYVPRVASAMTAYNLMQDPPPTLIGERVNSQGSRVVKRLLLEDDYEGVVGVARDQAESGAHLLDVCVALTERQDEADQMRSLVKLLAQSVETPLVIDTTEANVVEVALKQYPGRAIVNSINLENGLARIEAVVPHVVEHGAAVIALTIDELGMAKTVERKLEIARRITDIVTQQYGLAADALIFDDLTFTLATGDAEFRRSAIETIEGITRIKSELPGVLTSLGVSNVSFGLAKHARAVLNSVFLHHCVSAGLDMAIVNPAHIKPYAEIDEEQRALSDDLIFDRREDALTRFIAHFESASVEAEEAADPTAAMEPEQALHWKILHRKRDGIESFIDSAVAKHGGGNDAGVWVLNNVLLPAMKEVGDKFGAGELILPFVLQSAEVMKTRGRTAGDIPRQDGGADQRESRARNRIRRRARHWQEPGLHDPRQQRLHRVRPRQAGADQHDHREGRRSECGRHRALGSAGVDVEADAACVQELNARGLSYPVLIGGAAINPSFVRMASFIECGEAGAVWSGRLLLQGRVRGSRVDGRVAGFRTARCIHRGSSPRSDRGHSEARGVGREGERREAGGA